MSQLKFHEVLRIGYEEGRQFMREDHSYWKHVDVDNNCIRCEGGSSYSIDNSDMTKTWKLRESVCVDGLLKVDTKRLPEVLICIEKWGIPGRFQRNKDILEVWNTATKSWIELKENDLIEMDMGMLIIKRDAVMLDAIQVKI